MKKKARRISYDKWGYIFIAPFFVVFLMFDIYPMLYTINLSFTDFSGWKQNYSYIWFDNYIWLIKNRFFLISIGNTFLLWIGCFIPQTACALFFAELFTNERTKIRGVGFFKVIYYMPNIITAASVAMIFQQLFSHPYGPIEQILRQLGIADENLRFLQNKTYTRMIVIFIQFWMWFGHTMIVDMATMLSINPNVYEAARIDGASEVQIFFRITLPLMRSMLVYMFVSSMVGGLQMFDIPFLLAGGGPDYATETLATYIYKQAFTGQQNYNIAAAGSMYLLAIALLMSRLIFWLLGERDSEKRTRRRVWGNKKTA